jgi:Domain of unknown function DUF29
MAMCRGGTYDQALVRHRFLSVDPDAGRQKSLLQALNRLAKLLRDNPSLANQTPGFLDEGFHHARRLAAIETSLPLTTFPATCPWASEQALDENFWPEMAHDGT